MWQLLLEGYTYLFHCHLGQLVSFDIYSVFSEAKKLTVCSDCRKLLFTTGTNENKTHDSIWFIDAMKCESSGCLICQSSKTPACFHGKFRLLKCYVFSMISFYSVFANRFIGFMFSLHIKEHGQQSQVYTDHSPIFFGNYFSKIKEKALYSPFIVGQ